jgi:hypothetical protein
MPSQTSGSVTAATTAVTSPQLTGAIVPDNIALLEVSGTFTGITAAIQGSIDGTNWQNLAAVRCDTFAIEQTPTVSNSTTRQWKFDATGMQYVRLNVTALSTGTLVVQLNTTYVPGGISVQLAGSLSGNQAISGTQTITSASATSLTVGPNGATNPVLTVDGSTASAATGVKVKGAAAAGGVALTVTTSGTNESATIDAAGSGTITLNGVAGGGTGAVQIGGAASGANATGLKVTPAAAASGVAIVAVSTGTDENVTLDAKGAGTLTLNGTATGTVTVGANLTMANAKNIVFNTSTGTKIGTATSQKLAFYNSTPIVQPTASVDVTGFVAGSGTASKSDSVWAGASGASAYTVGGIVTALKNLGLLAA